MRPFDHHDRLAPAGMDISRKQMTIFVSHASDLITDRRAHGDGQVAFEQIQRLAERGHRLHIAYTAADLSKPFPDNVTLHQVVCRFPSSRGQEVEYMLRVRQLFRRLHRLQPFDLIHQFHPVFPGRSALLTSAGVPLVLGVFYAAWPSDAEAIAKTQTWRHRLATAMVGPLVRWADHRQQRCAAALLLSTPAAESCLADPEQSRPRCVLLWCPGVNADAFTPRVGQRPTQPPSILFLGNLELRKGIFILAEAFRMIWARRPDVRLKIVGKGSQEAVLQRYVEEDGSKQNVEFFGELQGENKKSALRSADLVAIPSFGEPHGIVALEAMACAKPIVATRAGGLQHLMPAEGVRLVSPRDAPSLAEALLELLAKPEIWPRMGESNRRAAVECFDWPRIIDRLEKVYCSVTAKSGLRS